MVQEAAIVVQDRAQLIALLAEAAEIEHNLMCCYIYAALSLKTRDDAGLNADELEATRRWRKVIMEVAVEEMLHLGLTANLLTAVGAIPHFKRPNFPIPPGYHPADVVLELRRFNKDTIDHFVYLERPEGSVVSDGAYFQKGRQYHRAMRSDTLMPTGADFETVGHLYRSIAKGFTDLCERLGEKTVFAGDPAAQLLAGVCGFPGLVKVVDLKSALQAIEEIIEQGEGMPHDNGRGHYHRFCSVRDELAEMLKHRPSFEPAWPCASNPVMRPPAAPEGKVFVTNPVASDFLDLSNATYGLCLRCLMTSFGQSGVSAADRALAYSVSRELMHALMPLGDALAEMPATLNADEPTAGLTFTVSNALAASHDPKLAMAIIHERAVEIGERANLMMGPHPSLAPLAASFKRVLKALQPATSVPSAPQQDDKHSVPSPEAEPSKPEVAKGHAVTITFDSHRCIHSRFCVLEAPDVFKANTPGEWIFPDNMPAERLVAVAQNCPSGAITFTRNDGGAEECPPPVNLLRLRENGPYAVNADCTMEGAPKFLRATLCRCGASKNKPYCDNSHKALGFHATGEPDTLDSAALSKRDGPLTISPQRDGPLCFSGPLEIVSGTGRTINRVSSAKLCRCGGSATKPFCDGTHKKIGFKSGE